MKISIFLGHPAHFHMYKNIIKNLQHDGHHVDVLIKKKDILEKLLQNSGIKYINILKKRRKGSKFSMLLSSLKRMIHTFNYVIINHPDILCGSSDANSFIGPLFHIPVINTNEDDAAVVPLYAKVCYPGASVILNPTVCNSGKWDKKAIKYESYQELAYLHPNHFTPRKEIVEKYFSVKDPYTIIRFALLTAHHDKGISGLNNAITINLIDQLSPSMNIYITSEKPLAPQFERYRISINPLDMHDVIAFSSLLIGDSQTMAAEAGVLGVPFIRFNDFVGKIGYLNELENKYKLGYGIQTKDTKKLYETVDKILKMPNRNEVFKQRRKKMLTDKIDLAKFLTWFIEGYPNSKKIMKKDANYQYNFK